MKQRTKTLLLITILSLFIGTIYKISVNADSGGDTDYDTGGSSSWDSSWNDSWDTDYGNFSDSAITNDTFVIIIIIAVTSVLFSLTHSSKRHSTIKTSTKMYNDLTDEEIHQVDKNINSLDFKGYAFLAYKDIQIAWMNFDNNTLRNLLTDELYNTYVAELEALSLKGQKNMMLDINLIEAKLFKITEINNIINIDLYLAVECYDYVVDADNNVVRGNKMNLLRLEYELSFTKVKDSSEGVVCPRCGAQTQIVAGGICEFCRSNIISMPQKYVLSKKKMINQEVVR